MSTAAATRDAVGDHPFLRAALRAGVVNYTAAAEFLDVDGQSPSASRTESDDVDDAETDAVATALRRFAEELPAFETRDADARVRMESGVGLVDAEGCDAEEGDGEPLLTLGGAAVVPDAGSLTAVLATGEVDVGALAAVCGRLDAEDIDAEAAAVAEGTLLVVVDRRDGVSALRAVEDALAQVPA